MASTLSTFSSAEYELVVLAPEIAGSSKVNWDLRYVRVPQ